MRKILVYDNLLGGHHLQYLIYLIEYVLKQERSTITLVICAPMELAALLDVSRYKSDHLTFDLKDFSGYRQQGILTDYKNIQIVSELVEQHQVDDVLLMYLDGLFKPICKAFHIEGPTIRGIYFSNYVRWVDKNLSFLEWMRQLFRFKASSYFWLIWSSKKFDTIYILADYFAVEKLNKDAFLKKCFGYVPEPVIQYAEAVLKDYQIRAKSGVGNNAKVFLITGVLAPRKNVTRILEAAQKAAKATGADVCILIAGPTLPASGNDYKKEILNIMDAIQREGNITIKYEDRALTDEELNAYIYASDFVCIPYWGFYNASAILVQSIFNGKPILAPNTGYCAEITTTYSFGICVNPYSVEEMAAGIEKLLDGYEIQPENQQAFLDKYSPYPSSFAKILLER